jgi:hypothetical protein
MVEMLSQNIRSIIPFVFFHHAIGLDVLIHFHLTFEAVALQLVVDVINLHSCQLTKKTISS